MAIVVVVVGHHSARTDIGIPGNDGGIRANIGFLVDLFLKKNLGNFASLESVRGNSTLGGCLIINFFISRQEWSNNVISLLHDSCHLVLRGHGCRRLAAFANACPALNNACPTLAHARALSFCWSVCVSRSRSLSPRSRSFSVSLACKCFFN